MPPDLVTPGRASPPAITVVIAVRNAVASIESALRSVIDQHTSNHELIVIDGGSTDGTLSVLERLSGSIRYWSSEPDGGIYDAWNKALLQATGDWVYFLGADDRLREPDVLHRAASALATVPPHVTIAYASVEVMDGDSVVATVGAPWADVRAGLRNGMVFDHGGTFHRRSMLDRYGGFDPTFRIAGDYELIVRAAAESAPMFIPNLVVAHVALGGASSDPRHDGTREREKHRARRRHGMTNAPEWTSPTVMKAVTRAWIARTFGVPTMELARDLSRRLRGRPTEPANTVTPEQRHVKQICTRCVMDTSDPNIAFDERGVCSHCRTADRVLPTVRWTEGASEAALAETVSRIKRAGSGQEYDCVVGLSGGVDSSYVAYLAHANGLRPLAVHFDNGWNSELAVENIQRVVEGCGFDLHTYVIDWREFRDLQRAFLRASVLDIELLTDNAIVAATVQLAREHRIKYLLSGWNLATEHGLPAAWAWHKFDWTNIKAIHAAYGSVPLKTFPHISTLEWRWMRMTGRGVETVSLLNLVNYRRDEAAATLAREFGWREYGGKHHESAFTKFYQAAILPQKFGIDKRRVHLSDRIRNGELTRGEALETLARPIYEPDELRVESEYVRKKLGFEQAEWEAIMAAPPRSHREFASDRRFAGPILLALRLLRRLRELVTRRPPRP